MKSHKAIAAEKLKMHQLIKPLGGNLTGRIGFKNIYLVEDLEYLLPVKFYEIPHSGFKGEV